MAEDAKEIESSTPRASTRPSRDGGRLHQRGGDRRDIFGPETIRFSWQIDDGRGVISTYASSPIWKIFYERSIVATRRLGIQFISTTGFLLGSRDHQTGLPAGLPTTSRILMKSSKLCEQTIQDETRS